MKSLLGFRRKGGFLGIDLGSYAIKVAEAVPGKNGPVLKSFGQIRLPRGSVLSGVFKDPDIIIERLSQLIDNLNVKSKRAIISLSSYAAIIKRIELRLPEGKDLDSAVYEEAEAHIPFNLDDVYLDYQIFSEEENKFDILLVAARKEVIEELANLVEKAGLIPTIVDVDILAVGNIFEHVYQITKPSLLVDFGASKASVILWGEGGPLSNRDISFGAQEITEELQRELTLSFEEAENIKIQGVSEEEQKKVVKKCFLNTYNHFVKDLKNTIEFFKSRYPSLEIQEIYLCGGGSKLPQLKEFLEKETDLKINFFQVFSRIEHEECFDREYLDTINKEGIVALSLSVRELITWSE